MNAELRDRINDLLHTAGFSSPSSISPCAVGGNNRLYRVETPEGIFAAKEYFRHRNDSRDRLGAEFAFLSYASEAAPGFTPKPYACSKESGMALYEFIEGKPFHPGDIGRKEVDMAIRFFRALNAPEFREKADLPLASEAVFSISDHLSLVSGRIGKLLGISADSEVDAAALAFCAQMKETWEEITEGMPTGQDLPLPMEMRCISPSDFGFHNAIRENSDAIRFIDFEYAGWDDPGKTAGDFFSQIAVPVPFEYHEHFVAECMSMFPGSEQLGERARMLRPVYQMKWCCIALNVFLKVNLDRRKFADSGTDEQALKSIQLGKAKKIFQSIQKTSYGLH